MAVRKCKATGKVRYRDELTAKLWLATIRHTDSPTRPVMERRVYRCPHCAGFHLTSTKR